MKVNMKVDAGAWQQLFSDIGSVEFPRAVGVALNTAARYAKASFQKGMDETLKKENKFTQNAIGLKRIDFRDVTDGSVSEIFIKPQQSAYLKYLFGQDSNVRVPGDVGLAASTLLIPDFNGLARIGIRPTSSGQLPRNATIRAFALLQSKAKDGQPSAFFGRPKGLPNVQAGLFLRDPRVISKTQTKVVRRKDGSPTVVPKTKSGSIHRLFTAIRSATYKPNLEALWQASADTAGANIGKTFKAEFASKLSRKIAGRKY